MQALRAKCVPAGSGLRAFVAAGPAWPEGELCEDELCELLCEDEPWLELLDLAPAGAAASATATIAMDKDRASFVFSIVIPPKIRIAKD